MADVLSRLCAALHYSVYSISLTDWVKRACSSPCSAPLYAPRIVLRWAPHTTSAARAFLLSLCWPFQNIILPNLASVPWFDLDHWAIRQNDPLQGQQRGSPPELGLVQKVDNANAASCLLVNKVLTGFNPLRPSDSSQCVRWSYSMVKVWVLIKSTQVKSAFIRLLRQEKYFDLFVDTQENTAVCYESIWWLRGIQNCKFTEFSIH